MDVLVLIDKLDDLVHNAKAVPLTDQVRIDREEIYDILDQMRATIPEEIKQARWIVKERQEMLAEAKRETDRILGEAREQAVREASQTEIVKLAERQAQEIVDDARRQARETRLEMEDWADGILSTLEVNLDKFLDGGQARPRAAARALAGNGRCGRRPQGNGAQRAGRRQQLPLAGPMTRYPLRRLRLRPGEEQRDIVPIELEPFELGGQRYLPVPHEVEGDLTVAQATTGLDLRLAFDVRLHGPCVRCLADAVQDVHIDAREYQANEPGDAEELRSEYVVRRPARALRVGARRDRAGAPGPDPALARLRGALPRLRQGPERRAAHARRGRAGPALVGARRAARPPVVRSDGVSAPSHDGLDETQTFLPRPLLLTVVAPVLVSVSAGGVRASLTRRRRPLVRRPYRSRPRRSDARAALAARPRRPQRGGQVDAAPPRRRSRRAGRGHRRADARAR